VLLKKTYTVGSVAGMMFMRKQGTARPLLGMGPAAGLKPPKRRPK
jgi:hypothetical protein